MAIMRAVFNFVVAGAFIGILGMTLAGPELITWDNTAGNGDGMCNCGIAAGRGAATLITYQMRGTAVGALVGAIAAAVFIAKRRKVEPAPASPAKP